MAKEAIRRAMTRMLDDIVEDPADGAALLHPLGFFCFPLRRDGLRGVCLHVWDPELRMELPHTALTTSPIHSHSWDLVSCVLYGTVCNSVIEVSEVATQPEYRVVEICSAGEIDTIRPTSRLVRSTVVTTETHSDGDIYRLDANRFHTTDVKGAAATLAFGRGRPGAVDLSLGDLDIVPHSISRQRCRPETTARLARSARERIFAASPQSTP